MNTLEELSSYLHDRAEAADLGHTPVGVVTRAGLRRRYRRRRAATAGVLAVGALGAVGTTQLVRGGERRVATGPITTEPGDPTITTSPPPTEPSDTEVVPPPVVTETTASDSPLVWNAIDVDSRETLSSLTWITDTTSNGELGPYYRMSTAPGRAASEAPGTYRSLDGIHWEHLGPTDPDRPDALYNGRSVGTVDGRRYVLATPFVEDDSTAQPMSVSVSDDGDTWTDVDLPFDLGALAAEPAVGAVSVSTGGVAGYDGTTVLGALVSARADEASVAEAIGAPGSVGFDPTGEGFVQYATTPIDCDELQDLLEDWQRTTEEMEADALAAGTVTGAFPPQPGARTPDGDCLRWGDELRQLTASDIGRSAEAEAADRGLPVLFTAADDGTFTRVAAPTPPSGEQVSRFAVTADGEGYVAIISTYGGTYAYRSDATLESWRQIGSPLLADNEFHSVEVVGSTDDHVVLVTENGPEPPLVSTLEGDGWITTSISGLVTAEDAPQWNQGAVGSNGVALIGSAFPPRADAPPVLAYSPDGLTWSVTELSELTDMSNHLVTGLMMTGDEVLVTVRAMTDLEDRDAPLPGATVLVGTLR